MSSGEPYEHCRESLSYMAAEKPEGTIVLVSFIGGSSYFQVSEQGPSFWGEMISENQNALWKDLAQGLLRYNNCNNDKDFNFNFK